jgi:hypothetical protein
MSYQSSSDEGENDSFFDEPDEIGSVEPDDDDDRNSSQHDDSENLSEEDQDFIDDNGNQEEGSYENEAELTIQTFISSKRIKLDRVRFNHDDSMVELYEKLLNVTLLAVNKEAIQHPMMLEDLANMITNYWNILFVSKRKCGAGDSRRGGGELSIKMVISEHRSKVDEVRYFHDESHVQSYSKLLNVIVYAVYKTKIQYQMILDDFAHMISKYWNLLFEPKRKSDFTPSSGPGSGNGRGDSPYQKKRRHQSPSGGNNSNGNSTKKSTASDDPSRNGGSTTSNTGSL